MNKKYEKISIHGVEIKVKKKHAKYVSKRLNDILKICVRNRFNFKLHSSSILFKKYHTISFSNGFHRGPYYLEISTGFTGNILEIFITDHYVYKFRLSDCRNQSNPYVEFFDRLEEFIWKMIGRFDDLKVQLDGAIKYLYFTYDRFYRHQYIIASVNEKYLGEILCDNTIESHIGNFPVVVHHDYKKNVYKRGKV